MKDVLKVNQSDLESLKLHHDHEREHNNFLAALKISREMVERYPNYNQGGYRLIRDLIDLGNHDEAENRLKVISDEKIITKSHLILQYRIHVAKNEPESALLVASRYLECYPDDQWGFKAYTAQITKSRKKLEDYMRKRYLRNIPKIDKQDGKQLNLNIGAGDTYIDGFVGLDHDTSHYGDAAGKGQITYNMRGDQIPVDDGVVDNIYISHVIEHVEDEWVFEFFKEAARVLKPGGCLRISCPDAEFLWDVSRFENSYWYRRHPWFKARGIDPGQCDQWDFLTREICTPRLRFKENPANMRFEHEDLNHMHERLSNERDFASAMSLLVSDARFSEEFPGNHINYWTFDKINMATKDFFKYIIRSKYQGCVHREMTGEQFDQMGPAMSLYVDCIK